jgi:hypothetical protein
MTLHKHDDAYNVIPVYHSVVQPISRINTSINHYNDKVIYVSKFKKYVQNNLMLKCMTKT